MYCKKCGKLNEENSKFCIGCGAQLNEELGVLSLKDNVFKDRINIKLLTSIILSVVSIILPFCTWINAPTISTSSWSSSISDLTRGYSLFSYTAAIPFKSGPALFLYIISLIAIIAMVFNLIYIIKVLYKKKKQFKFCIIGSAMTLLSSIAFLGIIVSSNGFIQNVITITVIPVIAVVINIINIVITESLKRQDK